MHGSGLAVGRGISSPTISTDAGKSCLRNSHCLTKNLLLDSSPNQFHLKRFLPLQQNYLLAHAPLQNVRKLITWVH